mmetsp:Transcript_20061/g.46723  ORF Transcript_20061/g.46723 Transcript_20061/m.46723 type:complete len:786 (-) Transcript_20061:29-2386(-)
MQAALERDDGPIRLRPEQVAHRSPPERANIIYPQEPEARISHAAIMRAIYNEARAGVGSHLKGWEKVRAIFLAAKSVVQRKRVLETIWWSRKESEEEAVRKQSLWLRGLMSQISQDLEDDEPPPKPNIEGKRSVPSHIVQAPQHHRHGSDGHHPHHHGHHAASGHGRNTVGHAPRLRVARRASFTRDHAGQGAASQQHHHEHHHRGHGPRSTADSESEGFLTDSSDEGPGHVHGRSYTNKSSSSKQAGKRSSTRGMEADAGPTPIMRGFTNSFGILHDHRHDHHHSDETSPRGHHKRSSTERFHSAATREDFVDGISPSGSGSLSGEAPMLAVGLQVSCSSRPSTSEGTLHPGRGSPTRRLMPARRASSPPSAAALGADGLVDAYGAEGDSSSATGSEDRPASSSLLSKPGTSNGKRVQLLMTPEIAPMQRQDSRISTVSNSETAALSLEVQNAAYAAFEDMESMENARNPGSGKRHRKRPARMNRESSRNRMGGLGHSGGQYTKLCFGMGSSSASAPQLTSKKGSLKAAPLAAHLRQQIAQKTSSTAHSTQQDSLPFFATAHQDGHPAPLSRPTSRQDAYLTLLRRWPRSKGAQSQPLEHNRDAQEPQNPWQGCFDDLAVDEFLLPANPDPGSPVNAGSLLGGSMFSSQQIPGSRVGTREATRGEASRAGTDVSDWALRSGMVSSSRGGSQSTSRCGTGLPSSHGPGAQISSASRVATPSLIGGSAVLPPLVPGDALAFTQQLVLAKGPDLGQNFALMDLSRSAQCRLVDLGPNSLSPRWMTAP